MTSLLMPEWAAQQGVIFVWPHEHSDWRTMLGEIEHVYIAMVRAITPFQRALIVCYNASHRRWVMELLMQARIDVSRVECYVVPSNDTWIRDYGPLSVANLRMANITELVNFHFNAWGDKYQATYDPYVSEGLHILGAFRQHTLKHIPWVLEGGALETDGAGTLLCHEHCVLAHSRNSGMTRPKMEEILRDNLGIQRVLWITQGYLAGDDTDSHIDMLARFVNPTTICYTACDDATDEHYTALQAMKQELQTFTTEQRQPYQLIPLPWPHAKYDASGRRLPASYANFLITNRAVLVPIYQDAADKPALNILQRCFPNRYVVPIHALPLIHQCGSVHCATMQIAA